MSALKVVLGEQYSWKLREQVLASGDGDKHGNSTTCGRKLSPLQKRMIIVKIFLDIQKVI